MINKYLSDRSWDRDLILAAIESIVSFERYGEFLGDFELNPIEEIVLTNIPCDERVALLIELSKSKLLLRGNFR